MPFPDELQPVVIVASRSSWEQEFETLRSVLSQAFGDLAAAIDHIGSTSVPGLTAKDVIDIQVRVTRLDHDRIRQILETIGFRHRTEPWNQAESYGGVSTPKLVFAPPAGTRYANVHVRSSDSPAARAALLFRDFLRADEGSRQRWGDTKASIAAEAPELVAYGQMKQPAWMQLMKSAEEWAARTGWDPRRLSG